MSESGSPDVVRGNIDRLIAAISETRGIDLSLYRRAYVERRVAARLRTLGVHSYRQYIDFLEREPGEFDLLMNTLTINVTEFFRDRVVWDALRRNVFPEIVRQKQGRNRTIRVWSAGCSTGEEPYSIAMALRDALGDDASRFLVSVIATDLDPQALAVAERGIYDAAKRRRIPASYQVRFTQSMSASQFEIAPEVRRMVRFQQRSLFDDTPLRVIDLIMCRNVFIYFDRDQQAVALERFWGSLARGGHLVLGRSEKLSAEMASRLEPVDGKERIYRKPARP